MTVRILTPAPKCCEPDMLALNVGQPRETCARGRVWVVVDAIDNARGRDDWYVTWAPERLGVEVGA